jgi:hypothetical protein
MRTTRAVMRAFPTGDLTPEQIAADPWKNVKKYMIDMQQVVPLMKVHLKLTFKKVHNGSMPNKAPPDHWDLLPWEGGEKKIQELPVHPCVYSMWHALFDGENPTPLQKVMVAVNRGTSAVTDKKLLSKKELVLSLDNSITRIENKRQGIEHFEEKCSDMVPDARQGTKIPEKFIQQLETMARESSPIKASLSQRLSSFLDMRFSFVPPTRPKDSPPTTAAKKM